MCIQQTSIKLLIGRAGYTLGFAVHFEILLLYAFYRRDRDPDSIVDFVKETARISVDDRYGTFSKVGFFHSKLISR